MKYDGIQLVAISALIDLANALVWVIFCTTIPTFLLALVQNLDSGLDRHEQDYGLIFGLDFRPNMR